MAQAVVNNLALGSRLGVELQLPDQNKAAATAIGKAPTREKVSASVSPGQNANRVDTNASSFVPRNLGAYQRAILAYQESARFEEHNGLFFLNENRSDNGADHQELAITNILRAEPENSSAWSDLGLLYHLRGEREKVGAVYQILQTLDPARADTFSIKVGLSEKILFNIA